MNTESFIAFYGVEKIRNLNVSDYNKERLIALASRPVTAKSMQEFCELSVEPWRMHFPYKPDDMPPPQGDPQALRRIWNDPDVEIESISADQQAFLPAETDPWS